MWKCIWCGRFVEFGNRNGDYCSKKCEVDREGFYKNKQANSSNFSGGGGKTGVGNVGWVWWLIGIIIAVFIFLSPAMLFIYAFDLANPEGVMDTTLNSGWAWLGSALFWGGLIGGIIYLVKRKKANL